MNLIVRYAPIARKYAHNAVLFRKVLGHLEAAGCPEGYSFREATPGDLDIIRNHPEALAPAVYARRLERGDRCYCLVQGGEILSYNWVAFSLCCILCGYDRGIEFFPLNDDQAFTYDFYTYKARRGGGHGGLMKQLLLQELARQGVREVMALVMPHSTASLKIHLKAGYEPMCLVYGYRLLGWSRTWTGHPKDRHRLDAWIDEFRTANEVAGE
jgi:RimJ/RimL family protein N-acetyltransferase